MPPLRGRVNDLAGLLPAARAEALERKLESFERETSHQVVLLTVPSLDGEPVEDFSMRVAETWKIGQQRLDNGVIVVVAPKERRVRIEVGYGLEGVIPDVIASRIIRERMTPLFAQGRMADGIEAGLDAVMAAARGEEIPVERRPQHGAKGGNDPLGVLLFAAFASLFFGSPFRRRRAIGAVLGAGVAGGLTWLLLGVLPWTPLAMLLGAILGAIGPAAGMGGGRRGFGGPWGGWGGGGWGGGGGGFSGGGGGFGGGGASGSW